MRTCSHFGEHSGGSYPHLVHLCRGFSLDGDFAPGQGLLAVSGDIVGCRSLGVRDATGVQ